MTDTPMTPDAALTRLRQYGERTSTWSTATYNDGTEKVLHEIALTLAAEVQQWRATFGEQALPSALAEMQRLRARVAETPETLSALMATIQDLRALQQPLVDGLRFIREDMDRANKNGDEWATEWIGQVWMELPLQVRAAGGDTDAAQELADEARRAETAPCEEFGQDGECSCETPHTIPQEDQR